MKLYCYCFNMDGTVEKKKIICRKNKNDYVFKYEGNGCHEFSAYVPFDKIGVILDGFSYDGGIVHGCRMYLEEETEITDEMRKFATDRAQKLNELWEFKEKTYREIEDMKPIFGKTDRE